MLEINKDKLKKAVTEWNNVAANNGTSKRCRYNEEKNIVMMTCDGWDTPKEFTPLEFFSMLRCSGWECVPEKEKILKDKE